MMPVDLTNLRTITDGDRDTELLLFEEFHISGTPLLQAMQQGCVEGHSEDWRRAAHALKGAAYNLGAQMLGDLCKQAQESADATAAAKAALLSRIREEYGTVISFLNTVHP
jgi:HPt (histidine-containing phosphotransfer) domain-containing protein